MSGVSDFGASSWVAIAFGLATPPANFYVALCTDEPGSGWDGTVVASIEPTDPAYARQQLATGSQWVLSDSGFVINAIELDYPVPTADWGNITNFALTDALTGGNMWAWGDFLDETFIPAGYVNRIPVGSLAVAISNQLVSIGT